MKVIANAVLFVAVMVLVVPWLVVARLVARARGTEVVERRAFRPSRDGDGPA